MRSQAEQKWRRKDQQVRDVEVSLRNALIDCGKPAFDPTLAMLIEIALDRCTKRCVELDADWLTLEEGGEIA